MDEARAHLVFLRPAGLLLVKRPDADWRQLQDDYPDFMTSLGPWAADEIAEYFALDYTDDDAGWPFDRKAIAEFMRLNELVLDSESDAQPGVTADGGGM